jgi:hypothetical protein
MYRSNGFGLKPMLILLNESIFETRAALYRHTNSKEPRAERYSYKSLKGIASARKTIVIFVLMRRYRYQHAGW